MPLPLDLCKFVSCPQQCLLPISSSTKEKSNAARGQCSHGNFFLAGPRLGQESTFLLQQIRYWLTCEQAMCMSDLSLLNNVRHSFLQLMAHLASLNISALLYWNLLPISIFRKSTAYYGERPWSSTALERLPA